MDNKKVFEVENVKYAVLRPSSKIMQQGQIVYNSAFRQAVKPDNGKPGAIVRAALEDVLREQKLWDDAKQKKYEELQTKLLAGDKRLHEGGFKLTEARALALDMRRWRAELRRLLADRNSLDANTAEAQAENARFNYYVSACTVKADSGKPVWQNEDEYLANADTPMAEQAARLLSVFVFGLDEEWESKLPENVWLKKYGFINDKLHLIDKQKRLIDSEGRLVNEDGRYINEKNEFVDRDGNLLTEDGQYKVEFKPFLDDDGKPVPEPTV